MTNFFDPKYRFLKPQVKSSLVDLIVESYVEPDMLNAMLTAHTRAFVMPGSFDLKTCECVVRCLEGDGWVEFCIVSQGYGRVKKKLEVF